MRGDHVAGPLNGVRRELRQVLQPVRFEPTQAPSRVAGRLPYPAYDTALKLLKIKMRLQDRLFQKKPSETNPAANSALDDIILKAVAFNKENRYPTCREFAKDIESYLKLYIA